MNLSFEKNNSAELKIMHVTKRDGSKETVSFDKVSKRLENLIFKDGKTLNIDYIKLAQRVCSEIYPGVHTSELDELAAQTCACLITEHADYGILASRLAVSNHHKKTSPSFSEVIENLRKSKNSRGEYVSIMTQEFYDNVQRNKEKINQVLDYERDYLIDYFGFKTLEKSYLLKSNGKIVERPQHLFMRVALAIHKDDLKDAIECYHSLSLKKCIHATPTLFNAGTIQGQLASCFLMGVNQDSIASIYDTLKDCALISKMAGGIGIHIHDIRARGSLIAGGMGVSNGITPMLRVFNNTARYVDQGGGRRNGSFAIYLEPWHADVFDFLEMKKNQGAEEARARDLFYALWIPDLFMKRVQTGGDWTLMCPNECPGLSDAYGPEFEKLYTRYEEQGLGKKVISAQKLWFKILESQIETGTPYMLYKDACNMKSNQKNLGTIKSSNLCCEIVEYSGNPHPETPMRQENQTAVCNLASISLPTFVTAPEKLKNGLVKIASKDGCPYCVLAKAWCVKWNISHSVVYDEKHDMYPQIFVTENTKNDPNVMIQINGYEEFIRRYPASYDFQELEKTSRVLTKNLNKIIDNTTYPIQSARKSNLFHRPIGLGVQGLADVFFKMQIPFDSEEAKQLNARIFETIYYGALLESLEISKKRKSWILNDIHEYDPSFQIQDPESKCPVIAESPKLNQHQIHDLTTKYKLTPDEVNRILFMKDSATHSKYLGSYATFEGSPMSQGLFQFDMWDAKPKYPLAYGESWENLRKEIQQHGIRNSLLVAPMPTASTAQILGNTECFEPITSNIYVRRTLAGEFVILNKYLQADLYALGLWDENMKNRILLHEGSIQEIQEIPQYIRKVYKTVWDMSQKTIIDMAVDRGKFICQSQSMNLFQSEPQYDRLTSMYFYAWKSGLKTGLYYLRTKPKAKAQTFTITPVSKSTNVQNNTHETHEICESCSG